MMNKKMTEHKIGIKNYFSVKKNYWTEEEKRIDDEMKYAMREDDTDYYEWCRDIKVQFLKDKEAHEKEIKELNKPNWNKEDGKKQNKFFVE